MYFPILFLIVVILLFRIYLPLFLPSRPHPSRPGPFLWMFLRDGDRSSYIIFILFYFILFYFILFYFILFYFILFYFILFYFILFYFILFYFL
jgi:hypothetical protein